MCGIVPRMTEDERWQDCLWRVWGRTAENENDIASGKGRTKSLSSEKLLIIRDSRCPYIQRTHQLSHNFIFVIYWRRQKSKDSASLFFYCWRLPSSVPLHYYLISNRILLTSWFPGNVTVIPIRIEEGSMEFTTISAPLSPHSSSATSWECWMMTGDDIDQSGIEWEWNSWIWINLWWSNNNGTFAGRYSQRHRHHH